MSRDHKKRQLRRCKNCNKVGHNQATCTVVIVDVSTRKKNTASTTAPRGPKQPVKFFVHHVPYASDHSPHVVNLRKSNHDTWGTVETVSPEHDQTLYHSYHNTPVHEPPPTPPATVFAMPGAFIIKEPGRFQRLLQKIQSSPTFTPDAEQIFHPSLPRSAARPISVNLVEIEKETPATAPALRPIKKPITWHKEAFATIQNKVPIKYVSAALVLLLVIITIPGPAFGYYQEMVSTKTNLVNDSSAAFLALQDSTIALKRADLAQATSATQTALAKFNSAFKTLEDHRIIETVTSIIPGIGDSLTSRQKLLLAGQEITVGNSYLLRALNANQSQASSTFTEKLQGLLTELHTALPNYEKAAANLADVDPASVPVQYQAQFSDFKTMMTGLVHDFKTVDQLGSSLLEMFGGEGQRRYLLVFQNPDELRPTGGFMGSFAVLEIKNGAITKLDIPAGGTYDLQGQLKQFVEPPTPLLLSNKRWEFQDANWFPDFPTSAEKILWFYRQSRGQSADGVIAINATVLQRLLSVVGPLVDAKRDVTLDAATAIPKLQKIVETGPEKKDNKPKQIIADLAPTLIDQIKHAGTNTLLPLLGEVKEAVEQKEIQTYFVDRVAEQSIRDLGWSGAMIATNQLQDFLMVVNTNIQGEKSDASIDQTISHQAVVSDDGSVVDTVVITRHHAGNDGEELYGHTNIDYLRVYVPEGSELLNASGFTWPTDTAFRAPDKWTTKDTMLNDVEHEQSIDHDSGTRITTEFGKTAFGNWAITEPGATSQVTFSYRLPFKLTPGVATSGWQKLLSPLQKTSAKYQLVVERQSGSRAMFDGQIIFPDSWQPTWQAGEQMTLASNGARIAPTQLTKDAVYSLLMHQ